MQLKRWEAIHSDDFVIRQASHALYALIGFGFADGDKHGRFVPLRGGGSRLVKVSA